MSALLHQWVRTAVADIVGMFSINPQTLYGSIQEGPHLLAYEGIDQMEPEQLEDFSTVYKAFAAKIFALMHDSLASCAERIIDDGYRDVACNIEDYRLGMLVISVIAEQPVRSVLDVKIGRAL